MTYYRIKHDKGGVRRLRRARYSTKPVNDGEFVANELYTQKEAQRFLNTYANAELVKAKKTEIYWLFGARFANEPHAEG